MKLEMTIHEAALLKSSLTRRLAEMDRELVRTDKSELQHALARDVEELRRVENRLERELEEMRTEDGFV
jgi:hypothetical protein